MSVVTRVYRSVTTHYAVNYWRGKQVAEKVGTKRRDAEIRDRAMKAEIKAGTYKPKGRSARQQLVGPWLELFLEQRTNASAPDERRSVRLYVQPRDWLTAKRVDDVDEPDTDQLVRELRAERKPDGSRRLSDKTISNLLNVLSLAFDWGIRNKACARNPINLPPNTLKRQRAKEPEIYTPGEFAVLIRHHSIPWSIRVLNALVLFTGMREGEACGRRWRDFQEAPGLAAMFVRDQYNGQKLKTDNPRVVPVHPGLAEVLTAWAQEGFEAYTLRRPEPDDFIVPNMSKRARGPNHTRSSYYKAFVKYALAAGVRPRSLHATRHTFITLTQRCGARKEHVERVTHNASGDIVDRYTHLWAPLCEAVSCLNLEVLPDTHPTAGSGGNSRPQRSAFLPEKSAPMLRSATVDHGSIPGASTKTPHEKSLAAGPRKYLLQADSGIAGHLRERNAQRKRRLLALREADPDKARPGLALARGLDAAYNQNTGKIERRLAETGDAIGWVGLDEYRSALARSGGGRQ